MKNKTKLGLAGLVAIALISCEEPEPTIKMKTESEMSEIITSRYSVNRIAVFEDDLAYDGKRGIYEIKDNRTGKIYLGVSGIGITELGSHYAGEGSVSDER